MKITKETADKVVEEIAKISDDYDFLGCAVAPLKTEEETLSRVMERLKPIIQEDIIAKVIKKLKTDAECYFFIQSLDIHEQTQKKINDTAKIEYNIINNDC